jgi:uncharacterized membrane protein YraQ (UPF0718 family)
MEQITYILNFIMKSFIHVWPYLLITIPLAVWVNLSDFSKHFHSIMTKSPWLSILLATMVGAFSPFCSCGVIPVISSLLLGGVPLAPVFAFWVASPSMDPEIFFLSVSILGWKLAIWRLASTFCLSLMAGIITHLLVRSGYITTFLRVKKLKPSTISHRKICMSGMNFSWLKGILRNSQFQFSGVAVACCTQGFEKEASVTSSGCHSTNKPIEEVSMRTKLLRESAKSVWMISKFMGLAFLLNALLNLYIPQEWIRKLLNQEGFISVIIAAAVGIPVYTSNLTALPLIGGLLQLGLHPGAALAFLISGPLTTIPAMVAVYGIATRKVFGLYIFIALFGSLFFGILYYLLS